MAEGPNGLVEPAVPQGPPALVLRSLLFKLLPGFLPLIVYVVAEEFWGETVGLVAGISCGVVEFGFLLVRERKPDWLAFFDTLLLAALGGVSLALRDEAFFRIKPAVIEAVFAVLIGISAFGSRNLVMGRTLAMLKKQGLDLGPAEDRMRRMMGGMFAVVVLHILLTLAAALWASKELWLFVSGGLLYVMFGAWMAVVVGRTVLQRRRMRKPRA